MAKLFQPLVEYRETIEEYKLSFQDTKPPKQTIRRLLRLFESVDDPRTILMTQYPLSEILLIAFLAILSGANGWNQMESFGKAKQRWLKKFLKLENGIPSHDTFRRVFSLIEPSSLEQVTIHFVMEHIEKIKKSLKIKNEGKTLLCVDGKEQRGSGRNLQSDDKVRNLQTLHVFDASHEVCLFSVPIDNKTNEIPTAQAVLSQMTLKNAIVTFDAMNTQKKTIQIIHDKKGDYIGALKGNHEITNKEVDAYFNQKTKEEIKELGEQYYETVEKAHSQIETRKYYLSSDIKWFADKKLWAGLRSFVCYEKTTYHVRTKKETKEIRYYITSLKDVELAAQSIRGHWSIENKLHWNLDVNMMEDDNTTMDKNAFNNMSIMNKLSLSLYKLVQPLLKKGTSIRTIRKQFSWSTEDMLSIILNSFKDGAIEDALANATKTNNKGIKISE